MSHCCCLECHPAKTTSTLQKKSHFTSGHTSSNMQWIGLITKVGQQFLTTTHTQPFYGHFWEYTGEPVPEEIFFWTLWCKQKQGNRGRHTHNPDWHHSIWTNQRSTSIIPHIYTGCPSCCNPPNLSCLGTGTKYAYGVTPNGVQNATVVGKISVLTS